jgi:hypothetical protein
MDGPSRGQLKHFFEQIRYRTQHRGRDMGGKGIVRRSALALGLIFALGPVEGRAQQTGAAGTLTDAALF